MTCCPTCGQFVRAASADDVAATWLQHCIAKGDHITPDGRVSEAVAAYLLGIAPGTLENKRRSRNGPPAVRMGIRGSRWSYRLVDLANWLELHRYTEDD